MNSYTETSLLPHFVNLCKSRDFPHAGIEVGTAKNLLAILTHSSPSLDILLNKLGHIVVVLNSQSLALVDR